MSSTWHVNNRVSSGATRENPATDARTRISWYITIFTKLTLNKTLYRAIVLRLRRVRLVFVFFRKRYCGFQTTTNAIFDTNNVVAIVYSFDVECFTNITITIIIIKPTVFSVVTVVGVLRSGDAKTRVEQRRKAHGGPPVDHPVRIPTKVLYSSNFLGSIVRNRWTTRMLSAPTAYSENIHLKKIKIKIKTQHAYETIVYTTLPPPPSPPLNPVWFVVRNPRENNIAAVGICFYTCNEISHEHEFNDRLRRLPDVPINCIKWDTSQQLREFVIFTVLYTPYTCIRMYNSVWSIIAILP